MASERPDLFDERTVLNQTAALRLMVGALLRDEAATDDVVQETWLTAMRTPPRPGFEPASWLRGIARNLIRTTRRTDARRARRETGAAHSDLVPSTSESVMKLERLRELLDVVSALREPIRQAIILRYFDGLMPREIAQQLSISVETVKDRLHTGLRLLRSALDERHGGSRSSWQTAFAWLAPEIAHAGTSVTVASTFSFTTLLGAGLLMKTTLAVVAGIVVVLFVFRLSAGSEKPLLVDDRVHMGSRTSTDAAPDDVVAAPPADTRTLAAGKHADPAEKRGAPGFATSGRGSNSGRR
jgi:RNA polymerase sigma factor (sigma-70 family)